MNLRQLAQRAPVVEGPAGDMAARAMAAMLHERDPRAAQRLRRAGGQGVMIQRKGVLYSTVFIVLDALGDLDQDPGQLFAVALGNPVNGVVLGNFETNMRNAGQLEKDKAFHCRYAGFRTYVHTGGATVLDDVLAMQQILEVWAWRYIATGFSEQLMGPIGQWPLPQSKTGTNLGALAAGAQGVSAYTEGDFSTLRPWDEHVKSGQTFSVALDEAEQDWVPIAGAANAIYGLQCHFIGDVFSQVEG